VSLTDTLRAGVELAFAQVPDLVRLGTYVTKGGDPIYDAESDTLVGGVRQIPDVRILETSSTAEEREASPVTVKDSKFLIPWVDLPGIRPSEVDHIVMDNVKFHILVAVKVPGDALHIVFCREA